jgi:hypothetical protein
MKLYLNNTEHYSGNTWALPRQYGTLLWQSSNVFKLRNYSWYMCCQLLSLKKTKKCTSTGNLYVNKPIQNMFQNYVSNWKILWLDLLFITVLTWYTGTLYRFCHEEMSNLIPIQASQLG